MHDTLINYRLAAALLAALPMGKCSSLSDNHQHVVTIDGGNKIARARKLNPLRGLNKENDIGDGPVPIVGGTPLNPGDRPYLVYLDGCAGTLISPRVVLTAAHCFTDSNGDFTTDGVDIVDINRFALDDNTNVISFPICTSEFSTGCDLSDEAYVVRDPNFDEDSFERDFALIFLPEEITGFDYVALNGDENIPANQGDQLEIIGWGDTSDGGSGSNIPLKAFVDYIPNEACTENPYKYDDDEIFPDMMCAGGDGKDTCNGDSGGPMLQYIQNKPVQVGITSWGGGDCAELKYPGVYSRVSEGFQWITETICDGDNVPTDEVFCVTQSPTTSPYPTASVYPTAGPCLGMPVRVNVKTDEYPEETSWELVNTCTNTVEKSSEVDLSYPYTSAELTLYSDEYCVPWAQYTFTINDSFGDGICCEFGEGYYSIEWGADYSIIIEGDGDFGDTASKTFGSCEPPTKEPTDAPTKVPTNSPSTSHSPTKEPTDAPTKGPTNSPSTSPSKKPSDSPTKEPTDSPTNKPTTAPTEPSPTDAPTNAPSKKPTSAPTESPITPTKSPTDAPTDSPSKKPTSAPTESPVTPSPSTSPTMEPTDAPTTTPTKKPTASPTTSPTKKPTVEPTDSPTKKPTTDSGNTPRPTTSPTKGSKASKATKPSQEVAYEWMSYGSMPYENMSYGSMPSESMSYDWTM